MRQDSVPSDVIKAVFHYLGKSYRFPANVPKIHEAFYALSQESALSKLFEEYVFDTSKMYPYSLTVSDALDRLQKSSLLACINPGLDNFEVSETLANWPVEDTGLFESSELELIKKAADKFKSYSLSRA